MSKRRKTNPVAKNLNQFNKPATHVDTKKRALKGYRKHKGGFEGDVKAAA